MKETSRIVGYKIKSSSETPQEEYDRLCKLWNEFDSEPLEYKTLQKMEIVKSQISDLIFAHPFIKPNQLKVYSLIPPNEQN